MISPLGFGSLAEESNRGFDFEGKQRLVPIVDPKGVLNNPYPLRQTGSAWARNDLRFRAPSGYRARGDQNIWEQ
jgi:hypothetical protein